MIVLSGASASGKTEVAKLLAKTYGITKIITTTTRPMRVGEVNGKDYFFVSVDEFKKMIDEGRFVEYTNYNNNFYGSTKDQIQDNRCVVIDPSGLNAYMSLNDPRIVTFYLEVTEETRYQRMLNRGDKIADAKKRILNDRIVFNKDVALKVDFIVDNENNSLDEVTKMVYETYLKELEKRQLEK